MVKSGYYGIEDLDLVRDHIKVFKIIYECKITKTRIFIPRNNLFLTEKRVKKGYYRNECFDLARDRIEVCQMNLFTTNVS